MVVIFILWRVIFEPDAKVQRYGRLDFPVVLEISAKDAAAETLDSGGAAVAEPAARGDTGPEVANPDLIRGGRVGVGLGADIDVTQDAFIAGINVVIALADELEAGLEGVTASGDDHVVFRLNFRVAENLPEVDEAKAGVTTQARRNRDLHQARGLGVRSSKSKLFANVAKGSGRRLVLVEAENVHANTNLVENRGSKRVGPVSGAAPAGLVGAFCRAGVGKEQTGENSLTGIVLRETAENAVLVAGLVVDAEIALVFVEIIARFERVIAAISGVAQRQRIVLRVREELGREGALSKRGVGHFVESDWCVPVLGVDKLPGRVAANARAVKGAGAAFGGG